MKPFLHGGKCADACCLRVQNLSVTIGNQMILSDVNLHVHCGQMVAVIGPNGAGKSTFLKAVLGQQDYDGVIVFSAPGQRGKKPKIGYVPGKHSRGASLSDMAGICLDCGMVNAVNLDGGGSAQILLGKRRLLEISDRKADGSQSERPVPNALIVK